jgi:hypothetical protein
MSLDSAAFMNRALDAKIRFVSFFRRFKHAN